MLATIIAAASLTVQLIEFGIELRDRHRKPRHKR
ncbi:hypothetical protein BCUN_0210 [Bifidobacterium cuniculi]|uniref:Uncharacterized protein n=1 Tax=Bifidobacterium cuniculi TaxID=1688 RepID=A0A087B3W5_9BIFI|nr:hypothetical protein BCUN_0210 [Bifidobacterium cuniculi]